MREWPSPVDFRSPCCRVYAPDQVDKLMKDIAAAKLSPVLTAQMSRLSLSRRSVRCLIDAALANAKTEKLIRDRLVQAPEYTESV